MGGGSAELHSRCTAHTRSYEPSCRRATLARPKNADPASRAEAADGEHTGRIAPPSCQGCPDRALCTAPSANEASNAHEQTRLNCSTTATQYEVCGGPRVSRETDHPGEDCSFRSEGRLHRGGYISTTCESYF